MTVRANRRRSNRWRGLALLAAALIVVSACGSATPTPAPGASASPASNAGPGATGGTTPATGTPAGETPSPAPAGPPLSETLIAAALAAGTITYEQSLLYRALALFDSPGLPAEFRSPVLDMGAATALLKEIDQKEAELSAGLLEQLAPYRARPADPVSIFNNPPIQGSSGMVYAVATPPPTWVSRPVDGTGARVWVKDSPFTETQLERFADAVATVWPQLPGVFRYGEPDQPGVPNLSVNPDSAIDLYFVETGTLDLRDPYCLIFPGNQACSLSVRAYGYAQRAERKHGTSSSGYVVINAGLPDALILDTVAHELTHVGQYAYDRNESSWLMESTATWAAYRVMKKLNLLPGLEYEWLTGTPFFAELDKPLAGAGLLHGPYHAYASWLFFLFASMEAGDGIVTRVWEAAAALGVQSEKAVDQAFPFDEHFADFAVRNWNQDPVTQQYKDADPTFPGGLRPETGGGGTAVMSGADEARLSRWVYPLASVYYAFRFEDDVRMVTFENTLARVPHAHVWAIRKIGDRWAEPEDWTGDARREFCRDVADQNVAELVLIVSNSDSDVSLDGLVAQDPTLTTRTACPAVTRATATYTKDSTGVGIHTWSRLSMVVVGLDGNGNATATVDYQWDRVETLTSSTRTESVRGSGTVDAWIGCSIDPDGTVGVETSWTDLVPATRTNNSGDAEASFLEFQGFMFTAQVDPNAKATSGSKTEDDSSADGADVAVYTWDCPNPTP